METESSNIAEYKVIPHNLYTYGIGPGVEPTLDTIKTQELWKTLVLLAFYAPTVLFVAGVHCKLDNTFLSTAYWSTLLIPFSIALVPLVVYYYMYIKSQMGFTMASFFCMKTTIFTLLLLCVSTQVFLLMLRADGFVATSYAVVFTPTYLCIFVCVMLFFILIPLSLSCQMPFIYYDSLLAVYCISSCFFFCYLTKRLDNHDDVSTQHIFQPLWIAYGIHFLLILPKLREQFWTIMFLLLAFIFTLEEYLRIEDSASISWWIPTFTFALGFAIPLFAN